MKWIGPVTLGLNSCCRLLWILSHPVVSVTPCGPLLGCTDIDDALHVVDLPNGNYEVGVHIADVSHFIRPGSAIDQEAAKRGTTVYLSNRRCG